MTTPLSPEQTRALAQVLDAIIPPSEDGRLPGAGALGLVERIAAAVSAAPDLLPALEQGLAVLAERIAARDGDSLGALGPGARSEVLNEVAAQAPAFLPGLIFHTYTGYYQHPQVVAGLGMEARPPHPLGYPIEASDWSLLDPVRARPKLYRKAEGS